MLHSSENTWKGGHSSLLSMLPLWMHGVWRVPCCGLVWHLICQCSAAAGQPGALGGFSELPLLASHLRNNL